MGLAVAPLPGAVLPEETLLPHTHRQGNTVWWTGSIWQYRVSATCVTRPCDALHSVTASKQQAVMETSARHTEYIESYVNSLYTL